MKLKKLIAYVVTSIFMSNMFYFAVPVSAAEKITNAAEKPIFRIVTDKDSYEVGESIRLSFYVENIDKALYWYLGGLDSTQAGISDIQAMFGYSGTGDVALEDDSTGNPFDPLYPSFYLGYKGDAITSKVKDTSAYNFYFNPLSGMLNNFIVVYGAKTPTAIKAPLYGGEVGYVFLKATKSGTISFDYMAKNYTNMVLNVAKNGDFGSVTPVDIISDVTYDFKYKTITIGDPEAPVVTATPVPSNRIIETATVTAPLTLPYGTDINSLTTPVYATLDVTFKNGIVNPETYADFTSTAWYGYDRFKVGAQNISTPISPAFRDLKDIYNPSNVEATWAVRVQPNYTVNKVENNKGTRDDYVYFAANQLIDGDTVWLDGGAGFVSFPIDTTMITANQPVAVKIPGNILNNEDGGVLRYYVVSGGAKSADKSYTYIAATAPAMDANLVIPVSVPYGSPWGSAEMKAQLAAGQKAMADTGVEIGFDIDWDNQYCVDWDSDSLSYKTKLMSEWWNNTWKNTMVSKAATIPDPVTLNKNGEPVLLTNGYKITVQFTKTPHVITSVATITTPVSYGTEWGQISLPSNITVSSTYGTRTISIPKSSAIWKAVGGIYDAKTAGTYTYKLSLNDIESSALPEYVAYNGYFKSNYPYYDVSSAEVEWEIIVSGQDPTNWVGEIITIENNRDDVDYITVSGLKNGDVVTFHIGGNKAEATVAASALVSAGTYRLSVGANFLNQNGGVLSSVEVKTPGKSATVNAGGETWLGYSTETPYMVNDVTLPNISADIGTLWLDFYNNNFSANGYKKEITISGDVDRTPTTGFSSITVDWNEVASDKKWAENIDLSKAGEYIITLTPGVDKGVTFEPATVPVTLNGLSVKKTVSFKIIVSGKKIVKAEGLKADGVTDSVTVDYGTLLADTTKPDKIKLTLEDSSSVVLDIAGATTLTGFNWLAGNYNGTLSELVTPYTIVAPLADIVGIPAKYIKPEVDINVTWKVFVDSPDNTNWTGDSTAKVENNRDANDYITVEGVVPGDKIKFVTSRADASPNYQDWEIKDDTVKNGDGSYTYDFGKKFLEDNYGTLLVTVTQKNKNSTNYNIDYVAEKPAYMKENATIALAPIEVYVDSSYGTDVASLLELPSVTVKVDRNIGTALLPKDDTLVSLDWSKIATAVAGIKSDWNSSAPKTINVEIIPGVTNGATFANSDIRNNPVTPFKITQKIIIKPKKVTAVTAYLTSGATAGGTNVDFGTLKANVPKPGVLELVLKSDDGGITFSSEEIAINGVALNWVNVANDYKDNVSGTYRFTASLDALNSIFPKYNFTGAEATWDVTVGTIQPTDWSGVATVVNNRDGSLDTVSVTDLKIGDTVHFREGAVSDERVATKNGTEEFGFVDKTLLDINGGTLSITVERTNFNESAPVTAPYLSEVPYMEKNVTLSGAVVAAATDMEVVDALLGTDWNTFYSAAFSANGYKEEIDITSAVDRTPSGTPSITIDWNEVASDKKWAENIDLNKAGEYVITLTPGVDKGVTFGPATNPATVNGLSEKKTVSFVIKVSGNQITGAKGKIAAAYVTNVDYGTPFASITRPTDIEFEYTYTKDGSTGTNTVSVSALTGIEWEANGYNATGDGVTYTIKAPLNKIGGIVMPYYVNTEANVYVTWDVYVKSPDATDVTGVTANVINNRDGNDYVIMDGIATGYKVIFKTDSGVVPNTQEWNVNDTYKNEYGTYTYDLGKKFLSNDGGSLEYTVQAPYKDKSGIETAPYDAEQAYMSKDTTVNVPAAPIVVYVGDAWSAVSSQLGAVAGISTIPVEVDRKVSAVPGDEYDAEVELDWSKLVTAISGIGDREGGWNSSVPKTINVEIIPGTTYGADFVDTSIGNNPVTPYKITQQIIIRPKTVKTVVAYKSETELVSGISVDYGTAIGSVLKPGWLVLELEDDNGNPLGTKEISTAGLGLSWVSSTYVASPTPDPGPWSYEFTAALSGLSSVLSQYDFVNVPTASWTVTVLGKNSLSWSGPVNYIINNRDGNDDKISVSGLQVGDDVRFYDGLTIDVPKKATKNGIEEFSIPDGILKNVSGSLNVAVKRTNFEWSAPVTAPYLSEVPYMDAAYPDYDIGEVKVEVGTSFADLIAEIEDAIDVKEGSLGEISPYVYVDRPVAGTTAKVNLTWASIASAIPQLSNWSVTASAPTSFDVEIVPGVTSGAVFEAAAVSELTPKNPNNKKITIKITVNGYAIDTVEGTIYDVDDTTDYNFVTVDFGTPINEVPMPDKLLITSVGNVIPAVSVPVTELAGLEWSDLNYKADVPGSYTFVASLIGVTGLPGEYTNVNEKTATWTVIVSGQGDTDWTGSIVSIENNKGTAEDYITITGLGNGDKVTLNAGAADKVLTASVLTLIDNATGTYTFSLGNNFLKAIGGTLTGTVQAPGLNAADILPVAPATDIEYLSEVPYMSANRTLTPVEVTIGASISDVETAILAATGLEYDGIAVDVMPSTGTPKVTFDWTEILGTISWDSTYPKEYRIVLTPGDGVGANVWATFEPATTPAVENPNKRTITQVIKVKALDGVTAVAVGGDASVPYNTPKSGLVLPNTIEFDVGGSTESVTLLPNYAAYVTSSSWTGLYNPTPAVDTTYTLTLNLKALYGYIPELSKYNVDVVTWDIEVKAKEQTKLNPDDPTDPINIPPVNNNKASAADTVVFTNLPYTNKELTLTIRNDDGLSYMVKANAATYTVTLPTGFLRTDGGTITYTVTEKDKSESTLVSVPYNREVPYVTEYIANESISVAHGTSWADLLTALSAYSSVTVITDKATLNKEMTANLNWNTIENKTGWESVNSNINGAEYTVKAVVNSVTDGGTPAGENRNNIAITIKVVMGKVGESAAPNIIKDDVINRYNAADSKISFNYTTGSLDTVVIFYTKNENTQIYSEMGRMTISADLLPSDVVYSDAGWLNPNGGEFYVTAQRAGELQSLYNKVEYDAFKYSITSAESVEITKAVKAYVLGDEVPADVLSLIRTATVTLEDGMVIEVDVDDATWTWYDEADAPIDELDVPVTEPADYGVAGNYIVMAVLKNLPTDVANYSDVQAEVSFKILAATGDPVAVIANNKDFDEDILTVESIPANYIVRIYSNASAIKPVHEFVPADDLNNGGNVDAQFKLGSSKTADGLITKNSGTRYVTIQEPGKAESAKVPVNYKREVPYMTASKDLSAITVEYGTSWADLDLILPKTATVKTDRIETTTENMTAALDWQEIQAAWATDGIVPGSHSYTAVLSTIYGPGDILTAEQPHGYANGYFVTLTIQVKGQTLPAPYESDISHVNRLGSVYDSLTVGYPYDGGANVIITVYRGAPGNYEEIASGGTNGTGRVTFNSIPNGGFNVAGETIYVTATRTGQSESEKTPYTISAEKVAIVRASDAIVRVNQNVSLSILESALPEKVTATLEGAPWTTDAYVLGGKLLTSFSYKNSEGNYVGLDTVAATLLATKGSYELYAIIDKDPGKLDPTVSVGRDSVTGGEVLIKITLDVAEPGQSSMPAITDIKNQKGAILDYAEISNLKLGDVIKIYAASTDTLPVYETEIITVGATAANLSNNILSPNGGVVYITRTERANSLSESGMYPYMYVREVPHMMEDLVLAHVTVVAGTLWTDVVAEIEDVNKNPKVSVDSSGNEDGKMYVDLDYSNVALQSDWDANKFDKPGTYSITVYVTRVWDDKELADGRQHPDGDQNSKVAKINVTVRGKSAAPVDTNVTVKNNLGTDNDTIAVYYPGGLDTIIRVYMDDGFGNPKDDASSSVRTLNSSSEMLVIGGLENPVSPAVGKIWVTAEVVGLNYVESDKTLVTYGAEKIAITRIKVNPETMINEEDVLFGSIKKPTTAVAYAGNTLVGDIDISQVDWNAAPAYDSGTEGNYVWTAPSAKAKFVVLANNDTHVIPTSVNVEWPIIVRYEGTESLMASQISITNKRGNSDDSMVITIDPSDYNASLLPITETDIIRLYEDEEAEILLGELSGELAKRQIDSGILSNGGGYVYVTITKPGYKESGVTRVDYRPAQPFINNDYALEIEVHTTDAIKDYADLVNAGIVPGDIEVSTDTAGMQTINVVWDAVAILNYDPNVAGVYDIPYSSFTGTGDFENETVGKDIENWGHTIKLVIIVRDKTAAPDDIKIINERGVNPNVFVYDDTEGLKVWVYASQANAIAGTSPVLAGVVTGGEYKAYRAGLDRANGGTLWFVVQADGSLPSDPIQVNYVKEPYTVQTVVPVDGSIPPNPRNSTTVNIGTEEAGITFPEYARIDLLVSGLPVLYAEIGGSWESVVDATYTAAYNKDAAGTYKFRAPLDLSTIYEFDAGGTDDYVSNSVVKIYKNVTLYAEFIVTISPTTAWIPNNVTDLVTVTNKVNETNGADNGVKDTVKINYNVTGAPAVPVAGTVVKVYAAGSDVSAIAEHTITASDVLAKIIEFDIIGDNGMLLAAGGSVYISLTESGSAEGTRVEFGYGREDATITGDKTLSAVTVRKGTAFADISAEISGDKDSNDDYIDTYSMMTNFGYRDVRVVWDTTNYDNAMGMADDNLPVTVELTAEPDATGNTEIYTTTDYRVKINVTVKAVTKAPVSEAGATVTVNNSGASSSVVVTYLSGAVRKTRLYVYREKLDGSYELIKDWIMNVGESVVTIPSVNLGTGEGSIWVSAEEEQRFESGKDEVRYRAMNSYITSVQVPPVVVINAYTGKQGIEFPDKAQVTLYNGSTPWVDVSNNPNDWTSVGTYDPNVAGLYTFTASFTQTALNDAFVTNPLSRVASFVVEIRQSASLTDGQVRVVNHKRPVKDEIYVTGVADGVTVKFYSDSAKANEIAVEYMGIVDGERQYIVENANALSQTRGSVWVTVTEPEIFTEKGKTESDVFEAVYHPEERAVVDTELETVDVPLGTVEAGMRGILAADYATAFVNTTLATVENPDAVEVNLAWKDTPPVVSGDKNNIYTFKAIVTGLVDSSLEGEVLFDEYVVITIKFILPVVTADVDPSDVTITNQYTPAGEIIEINNIEKGDVIVIYDNEDKDNILAVYEHEDEFSGTGVIVIPDGVFDEENGGSVWITVQKDGEEESNPVEITYGPADSYPAWTLMSATALGGNVTVDYNTDESVVKTQLDYVDIELEFEDADGNDIVLTLKNGDGGLTVVWNCVEIGGYDARNTSNVQVFEGTIDLPDYIDMNGITVVSKNVKVDILPPSSSLDGAGVSVENNEGIGYDSRVIISAAAAGLDDGDMVFVYLPGETIPVASGVYNVANGDTFIILIDWNSGILDAVYGGYLEITRMQKDTDTGDYKGASPRINVDYEPVEGNYPAWKAVSASIDGYADEEVGYNTSVESVKTLLNTITQFTVTFDTGDDIQFTKGVTSGFNVTWDTSNYVAAVAGTYVIEGTLILPAKLDANGVKVYQSIIVASLEKSAQITTGITVNNNVRPFNGEIVIDAAAAGLSAGDIIRIYSDSNATVKIGEATYNGGSELVINVGLKLREGAGSVYVTRTETAPYEKEESNPFRQTYDAPSAATTAYPLFEITAFTPMTPVWVDYGTAEVDLINFLTKTVEVTGKDKDGKLYTITMTAGEYGFDIAWVSPDNSYDPYDEGKTPQAMEAIFTLPVNVSIASNVKFEQYVIVKGQDASSEIALSDINVANNRGTDDVVTITERALSDGDIVIVYVIDNDTHELTEIGRGVYGSYGDGDLVIVLGEDLVEDGGEIYIVRIENGKAESAPAITTYSAEERAVIATMALDTGVRKVALGTDFTTATGKLTQVVRITFESGSEYPDGEYDIEWLRSGSLYEPETEGVYEIFGRLRGIPNGAVNMGLYSIVGYVQVVDNLPIYTITFSDGNLMTSGGTPKSRAKYDIDRVNGVVSDSTTNAATVLVNYRPTSLSSGYNTVFKDPGFTVTSSTGTGLYSVRAILTDIDDNVINTVDNYIGGTQIGLDTRAPASITSTTLQDGVYKIKYVVLDNYGSPQNSENEYVRYVKLRYLRGDFNGDGEIDITDLHYISSHVVRKRDISEVITDGDILGMTADINQDSVIDATDMSYVSAQLITGVKIQQDFTEIR